MAKSKIEDVDLYAILDIQITATDSEVWFNYILNKNLFV